MAVPCNDAGVMDHGGPQKIMLSLGESTAEKFHLAVASEFPKKAHSYNSP